VGALLISNQKEEQLKTWAEGEQTRLENILSKTTGLVVRRLKEYLAIVDPQKLHRCIRGEKDEEERRPEKMEANDKTRNKCFRTLLSRKANQIVLWQKKRGGGTSGSAVKQFGGKI